MPEPRNILFIFTDEHRLDTLGCYGNRVCRTANIDSLAGRGVVFQNAFTPIALCTPARASLLTGVYPQKHLMINNHEKPWGPPAHLSGRFPPFSRLLREAGYNIGTVGKWHIGEQSPADLGFDGLFYPGWDEARDHPDYLAYLRERGLPDFTMRDEIRGRLPNGRPGPVLTGIYDGPVEGTFTYYLAERTIAMLESYARDYRRRSRPFYLGFHLFGPHLPYYLPERYAAMYEPEKVGLPGGFAESFRDKPYIHRLYSRLWTFDSFSPEEWRGIIARYWGYVTMIDEQIGRVLVALRELGLEEETAVFFSTDHGSFEGSHRTCDKGPAAYDDIYRLPLLAAVPGVSARRGATEESLVTLTDLTATFLDLAGVVNPPRLDGRSLLPLLMGEKPEDWRREVFMEFHGHQIPYAQRMVRTHDYKLIANLADVNELYDLRQDPHELDNRIDDPAYGAIKKQLYGLLCRHLDAQGDSASSTWLRWMYDVD